MKNIKGIMLLLVLFLPFDLLGANPLMGEYENQVSVHLANAFSINNGIYKFYQFEVRYSQPNTFFRLPGRRNFEVFVDLAEEGRGEKNDTTSYNNIGAGLSQELGVRIYRGYTPARGLVFIYALKKQKASARNWLLANGPL
ncbi:hypothetical protein Dip510_001324 [Elusimicrobium posterum]|uniref:hypothetical protein n=1 Tax=Elusimicrobium posterum TaxID=3116653 RepID=UPI003C7548D5